MPPALTCHNRTVPDQAASHRGRQGKAFGGRTSVAQALAGARMAVIAKAGIQQRFTRNDVRCPFRTDRERSGIGGEGNRWFSEKQSWHVSLHSHGRSGRGALFRKFAKAREWEPAHRLPVFLLPLPLCGGGPGWGCFHESDYSCGESPHPALRADLPRKRER